MNNNQDVAVSRMTFHGILDQMVVFLGSLHHAGYEHPLYDQYKVVVEGLEGFSSPYVKSLLEEDNLLAALALTTRTAYSFDYLTWIEQNLEKKEQIHPLIVEQIVTVVHEAIANGILWSNLELESLDQQIRPLEFSKLIDEKLKHPDLARRYLVVSLMRCGSFIQVCLSVEGKPILWGEGTPDHFRGTAIIRELSDDISFQDNHQTICLLFNTNRGE